ncbi:MAG: hypothetical protein ACP5T4_01910 [Candidatus Micrarchaeia archaeon]
MDRTNMAAVENEKVIKQQGKAKDLFATDEGEKYRIPYDTVKEAVISNVSKNELIDLEHAARLQYKLLLNEAILRAKVAFIKQTISIIYNPAGSNSRNPSITLDEIISLIEKEGVHVDKRSIKERDVDYYKEIWYPQFHPKQIREHPPYGFTMETWKKIKDKFVKRTEEAKKKKQKEFEEWQKKYAEEHPEVKKEG